MAEKCTEIVHTRWVCTERGRRTQSTYLGLAREAGGVPLPNTVGEELKYSRGRTDYSPGRTLFSRGRTIHLYMIPWVPSVPPKSKHAAVGPLLSPLNLNMLPLVPFCPS